MSLKHIVVCLQDVPKAGLHLRIVAAASTEKMLREAADIYGEESVKHVRTYYNCSDLLPRLHKDVSYRRFKGATKKDSVFDGVWPVSRCDDPGPFFEGELVPFVMDKLRGYVEDDATDKFAVNWSSLEARDLVEAEFKAQPDEEMAAEDEEGGEWIQPQMTYTFKWCEPNGDGLFVLGYHHLAALSLTYHVFNSPLDHNAVTEQSLHEVTNGAFDRCYEMRGLVAKSVTCTAAEAHSLLCYFRSNCSNAAHFRDQVFDLEETFRPAGSTTRPKITIAAPHNPLAQDVFDCQPHPLPSEHISYALTPKTTLTEYYDQAALKGWQDVKKTSPEPEKNVILVKNKLTNEIKTMSYRPSCIVEATFLDEVSGCASVATKALLTMIEDVRNEKTLGEVRRVLDIIAEHVREKKSDACVPSTPTEQYTITAQYVKNHRSDNMVMSESWVLKCVENHLQKHLPPSVSVDTEQIKRDLLCLKVRRIVDADGIAFLGMQTHMLMEDVPLVKRNANWQLRQDPYIPKQEFSPWNNSSVWTPARGITL
jgi:hypothetical protein